MNRLPQFFWNLPIDDLEHYEPDNYPDALPATYATLEEAIAASNEQYIAAMAKKGYVAELVAITILNDRESEKPEP